MKRRTVLFGSFGAILIACFLAFYGIRQRVIRHQRDMIAQLEKQEFANELGAVRDGRSKVIRLSPYTGYGTDQKTQILREMREFEELVIDRADLTDAGLRNIAKMANIRRLAVFGTGITDAGFADFKHNDNIEALALVNTPITRRSLQVISTFRGIRILVIFDDCRRKGGAHFSINSLQALKSLKPLRVLKLGGPWLAEDDLPALRDTFDEAALLTLNACPSSDVIDLLLE